MAYKDPRSVTIEWHTNNFFPPFRRFLFAFCSRNTKQGVAIMYPAYELLGKKQHFKGAYELKASSTVCDEYVGGHT